MVREKLTTLLADGGYDMIGIDNSFDMLDMALEREMTESLSDAGYERV